MLTLPGACRPQIACCFCRRAAKAAPQREQKN
jgi:hypothetical protein